MKIALIIFPIHESHGCVLQTYALYTILLRLGHDVTIIDRQPASLSVKRELLHNLKNIVKKMLGKYVGPITLSKLKSLKMQGINQFVDKYMKDRIVIHENPNFQELPSFDAYVVGSDQVWRPKYVRDVMYYFLNFVPKDANVKRLAYAPSFGTDCWEYNEEQTAEAIELAQRFDAIASRENSGVRLCKQYLGVEAAHVVDPTMLLERSDYLKAADLEYSNDSKLSYYILDETPEKLEIVELVSKKMNKKAEAISLSTYSNSQKKITPVASIEKWLGGFAKSSFIIADSFHATVFAILFNKPFITIANKSRGLSRFEALLEMTGLENRMVFKVEDLTDELINNPIDWKLVNEKVCVKRSESLAFLKQSLG